MASDNQVALTRTHRMPAPSSHISKAARQVVPAFLQKLYEMVNDPNNAELIRWSEAGDSFFVLDHERFAHEVLGRWFKHRNFSSFVRQLNMYGFHKIPHLQQGVLKSDSDTEFWNFAHQNFHRGQPDLLCLIQRKKQVPQPGEDGAIDLRDPNAVGLLTGAGGAGGGSGGGSGGQGQGQGGLSQNQILDIHSIVQGIQAIKRHQTTISAELNELKRSNQLLWQDALAARAKHQKQQDTINRIVKFLAGVFGHHAAGGGPPGVGLGPTAGGGGGMGDGQGQDDEHDHDHMGMAMDLAGMMNLAGMGMNLNHAGGQGGRRRGRLMIEGAKSDGGPRKSMIEELTTEVPIDQDETMYEGPYPTIETPLSAPSPSPSLALSDNITIGDAGSNYYNSNSNNISNKNAATTNKGDSKSSSSAATSPSVTHPDSPILGSAAGGGGSAASTPTQQHGQIQLHSPNQGQSQAQGQGQSQSQAQAQGQRQQHGKEISRTVTPHARGLSPSQLEFDSRIHGMLNQLSPVQIQQLLASLASQTMGDSGGNANANVNVNVQQGTGMPQTINPGATTTSGGGIGAAAAANASLTGLLGNGMLTPYLQPSSFDFSINPATSTPSQGQGSPSSYSGNQNQNHAMPMVSPDGLISFDPYDPSPGGGAGGGNGGMNLINHSDLGFGNMGGMGGYNAYGGLGGGMHDPSSNNVNMNMNPHANMNLALPLTEAQADRLHRQWQGTEDVEKEMSMVDSSIQSLIQTFGLDPGLLDDASSFDFDSFFHGLSSTNNTGSNTGAAVNGAGDYGDISTSHVKNASASNATLSPNMGGTTSVIGRKRKSVDLEGLNAALDPGGGKGSATPTAASTASTAKGARSKRRKDK
ncbi:hypothetical protein CVT26_002652 [Gymnopilus dilepis]|uniref:HSF-type DNA-binding domain-containing protein n=1 Tax=Gymnopilus dilepis TaxID=231916 RepID=A0A409VER5_9AGAR|nr:hypothetical protein CVT26_002652 [Gymnopilus dilepis]